MWNAKKSNVSNARGSPRDMLMLISRGSDKIAIAPPPGLTTWANSPRWPGGMGPRWNWLMRNGICNSCLHTSLHSSPLPSPDPFTSSMFIRTAKAYSGERQMLSTQQHFPDLFRRVVSWFLRLSAPLLRLVIKIIAKNAAFWSGVRRATIAPPSQHVEKVASNHKTIQYKFYCQIPMGAFQRQK